MNCEVEIDLNFNWHRHWMCHLRFGYNDNRLSIELHSKFNNLKRKELFTKSENLGFLRQWWGLASLFLGHIFRKPQENEESLPEDVSVWGGGGFPNVILGSESVCIETNSVNTTK